MNPDLNTVCRLLEEDTLANLVTLKMVNRFPNSMHFELIEGPDGWALLSLLDVRDSEWDRKTYPACKYAVFINGNSDAGKIQLLASLPKENLVIKTGDEIVQQKIAETGKATKVRTFHSFTTGKQFSQPQSDLLCRKDPDRRARLGGDHGCLSPSPPRSGGEGRGEVVLRAQGERSLQGTSNPGLGQFCSHDERAWAMFRANGYEDAELAQYFQHGAQWFGFESEGKLASACFVFQNYKQIWEIGGVFTQPDFRRRGLAQTAVRGALKHLVASGLVPRYQTTADNHASLSLARSCGLTEFLQMTHYLLDAR